MNTRHVPHRGKPIRTLPDLLLALIGAAVLVAVLVLLM
jgi:hypothetical protein